MSRIYISGRMTGLPDLNYPAFNAKAAELRAQGLDVVNPAEVVAPPDASWEVYMRHNIRNLMECTAIYMMPGWSKSRGAMLEHRIAYDLGFSVTYGDVL